MTRLILDYYRRWSLVLLIGAALQLLQGWWLTVEPLTPFEFTASMIPICLGLLLPLFDLSRGVVRVIGTLPLSLAKLAHGWWLANVLIPANVLLALLFLGAGAAEFCHPGQAFPLNRLLMASLVTVLWLGTMFALVMPAIFPVTGKFRNRWPGILTQFVGAILTVCFVLWAIFGFVLSPGASKNPIMLAIFLAGGISLTFVGWLRAARFNPVGVRFGSSGNELSAKFNAYKAGAASSHPKTLSTISHRPPEGHGGILFLLRLTFINGLFGCFTSAIGILLFWWCASRFSGLVRFPAPGQGALVIDLREGFKVNNSSITVLLIFALFPLRPALMQLRFLRTLPISTAKLATVIMASVILPAMAVSMLLTGTIGLSVGTPAALTTLKSCLLFLAPVVLCVFFAVWRGGGTQAYILFFAAMMVWVLAVSACQNINFPLVGGAALAGVLLAWLLTYYALLRSGRAYRVQTDPLSNFPWIARR
jgi:hypothetical protein